MVYSRSIFCLLVLYFVPLQAGTGTGTGEVAISLDIYPNNTYGMTYIGQDLQCVCRHNLTGYDDVLPKWNICSEKYYTTSLPLHYKPYDREQYHGIAFQSIKEMNLTKISCCYLVIPNAEDTCSRVFTVVIADQLSIIDHPRNQTVDDGEMVDMDCGYVGTGALPLWNISGIIYSSTSLPTHFTALRDGLQFRAIPALNDFEFRCFFQGNAKTKSKFGRISVRQSGPGMNTNATSLTCSSIDKSQPAITGVYLDTTDSSYYVYWRSNCTLEMDIFFYKDCEQVGSLPVHSDPVSLNASEIPITDYFFQIQYSNMPSNSTLFDFTMEHIANVWYHNQGASDIVRVPFKLSEYLLIFCVVDMMQNAQDECSSASGDIPPPFTYCNNDDELCANVSLLKNMTLFTTFMESSCCLKDSVYCRNAISSNIVFIIGPPLRPPKPCAYVDSQSNAILCFQHPYTHPNSPISSYNVSIGNSNELYKHILLPSEVCQPFPIPSDLTFPLNFSVSAMNGAGYSNESEYTTVEDKLNEDIFCSCLASEFDIPVHLRVNDTTVEISHDELQPNFPDALQIDVCNATLHLMKNAEDVQPHTVLDSCNSSSVSLQLKDLSPDTNSIVFARIVLRIIGTDLTCNLTTNSAQLVSDPDSSGTNYVMIMVGITTAIFFIVKVLHRCCIAIILLNGNIIRGRSYSEKRTEITISIQQCEFLSVPS